MSAAHQRILAFDFGLRRIGVASGNRLTRTASPVTTLVAHGEIPWREIEALLGEWKPDLIVVGDPGLGSDSTLQDALKLFREGLADRFSGPIEAVDESHSSTAAAEHLRAARSAGLYNRRLNKKQIDSGAACLIAEQWMNQGID
jgi:putative Holliday junction resolvase